MSNRRKKMTREEKTKRNIKKAEARKRRATERKAREVAMEQVEMARRAAKAGIEIAQPGDLVGLDPDNMKGTS